MFLLLSAGIPDREIVAFIGKDQVLSIATSLENKMKKTVKQMVAAANEKIETLTTADAIALHGQEEVTFVDIRDVRELEREGQVPGAVHAPRGMLEFWVDPESPYHRDVFASGKKLIFFCAAGWRSALATATVKEMGLDNVAHIDGGFGAWRDQGGPVEERAAKKA
ncbi:MAG: rhodanese-related sulfurtransferase [Sneathiella sp.]